MVQENLTGIRVVKSFVREDYEKEKFAERNTDLKHSSETSLRHGGHQYACDDAGYLWHHHCRHVVRRQMVYAGTLPVG
ncbi:MAG: hypothetical protein ACLSHO_06465 [Dysosmobacter sp.]